VVLLMEFQGCFSNDSKTKQMSGPEQLQRTTPSGASLLPVESKLSIKEVKSSLSLPSSASSSSLLFNPQAHLAIYLWYTDYRLCKSKRVVQYSPIDSIDGWLVERGI